MVDEDREEERGNGFSPSIAIVTLARLVEEEIGRVLTPLDLTVRKLGLLAHIGGRPGISFSELARRSRVTVQSTHVAVQDLIRAGWVVGESARPGQSAHLALSSEGQKVLAGGLAAVGHVDAEIFRNPNRPQTAELAPHLLRAAVEQLSEVATSPAKLQ